jgi:hypothetical protein
MLKLTARRQEGYIGRLDEVLRRNSDSGLVGGHEKIEKSVLERGGPGVQSNG